MYTAELLASPGRARTWGMTDRHISFLTRPFAMRNNNGLAILANISDAQTLYLFIHKFEFKKSKNIAGEF